MKTEIEQQIFERMKDKDFGESMCNDTKLKVFNWVLQQLRKHDVSGAFVCGHPPNKTYLIDGTWHCDYCGGQWQSLANK